MCLLDTMDWWTKTRILCRTRSHLAADNPLRLGSRLAGVAGVEYGLQAMALHGALLQGEKPRQPGLLARLSDVQILLDRLDERSLGVLAVEARLERREPHGMIYTFSVSSETGRALVHGRAAIFQPAEPFTTSGEPESESSS